MKASTVFVEHSEEGNEENGNDFGVLVMVLVEVEAES
jgi:hypothetical protein